MIKPYLIPIAVTLALNSVGAQKYDLIKDFSPSNPAGSWTYGSAPIVGGPFIKLLNYEIVDSTVDSHRTGFTPGVFRYTGVVPNVVNSTFTAHPGDLWLHGGVSAEIAVVRWTAPANGLVSISGLFYNQDRAATTDQHILLNNTSIFSSIIELDSGLTKQERLFDFVNIPVFIGDQIDFAIGTGTFGGANDSTGLKAAIEFTVPDSSFNLIQVSIFGIIFFGTFAKLNLRK